MRTTISVFVAVLALLACTLALVHADEHKPYCQPFGQVTPRNTAPAFKAQAVIDEKFAKVSLEQYTKAGKWVVLLFYPYDFTFVCPTEILSFSAATSAFAEIDTQVLAISTDSVHTHLAWQRTKREDGGLGPVDIPLVADTSKQISRSYGVLVEDQDDPMFGAALRGLFIIDPTGKVRSLTINDDQAGRNVDEVLRLIKAFQYAATHEGEVCPASWQPGSQTIKANPEGIKEYFKAAAASSTGRAAAGADKKEL